MFGFSSNRRRWESCRLTAGRENSPPTEATRLTAHPLESHIRAARSRELACGDSLSLLHRREFSGLWRGPGTRNHQEAAAESIADKRDPGGSLLSGPSDSPLEPP